MSYRNAPLTPEGRLRLVRRCVGLHARPIAHVAAEASISRQCLSKWVRRYRADGEAGLADQFTAPQHSPTRIPPTVVELIIKLRKEKRWSALLIAKELQSRGHRISVTTVTRYLRAHGLHRLRYLDPDTGEPNRATRPARSTPATPGT